MKIICNIMLALLISPLVQAQEPSSIGKVDELTRAYQREILFLSTYKREIEAKRKSLEQTLGSKLSTAKADLQKLEKKWLGQQTSNELLLQKLTDIEKDQEYRKENREMLQITLEQAAAGQANFNAKKTNVPSAPLVDQLEQAFVESSKQLNKSLSITLSEETFYLANGEQTKGEVIQLGQVARFGRVGDKIAALSPSGSGAFRVHKWLDETSLVLAREKIPANLPLFLYDNPEKEFIAQKEKTTMDVIRSGGFIGWVIIVMGLFALAISVVRFWLLKSAGKTKQRQLHEVLVKIRENQISDAQHILLSEPSSVNRVLIKTLSYLKTEPSKVEDAILESILDESKIIDRFGVVILVIASVAPLLGLLGTVTGMISTFDIITLYGTGNPKLLSGGISEALVTTMFGLIVAIPALLVGQYLSGKSESIKSDMEQWALAACNAYQNRGAGQ